MPDFQAVIRVGEWGGADVRPHTQRSTTVPCVTDVPRIEGNGPMRTGPLQGFHCKVSVARFPRADVRQPQAKAKLLAESVADVWPMIQTLVSASMVTMQ